MVSFVMVSHVTVSLPNREPRTTTHHKTPAACASERSAYRFFGFV
jgi:hypothetical protein